jgi:hypothetical protein
MADLLELRDHLITANRQTEYFPDDTFSTWKYPAVAAVQLPVESPEQLGLRLRTDLCAKCPKVLSFQSRINLNDPQYSALFIADSMGKNVANPPKLLLAGLVSFVIFLQHFIDYASRGGTQSLLECIAADVKESIKLYAIHKYPHLSIYKSIDISNIPEIQFLEITLLRFATASESDKMDIKKHFRSIKMSSEKSHLFSFDLFRKFTSEILHAINLFRRFMTELNDKYYAKLISEGVSLPI